MSERHEVKLRTCHKCGVTIETDSDGIKQHAAACMGKPVVN